MHHRWGLILCTLIAWGLHFQAACGGVDEPLLNEVQTRNRTALESIHTIYCRVSIKASPQGPFPPPSGEYWRSADVARARFIFNGVVHDSVYRENRVLTLSAPSKEGARLRVSASLAAYDGFPLGLCDPWSLGLLTFSVESRGPLRFDELAGTAFQVRQIQRETEGGHEVVVVDLRHPKATHKLVFDPRVNYLLRKQTSLPVDDASGKGFTQTAEVLNFYEEAGVFFPQRIRFQTYEGDKLRSMREVVLADIRINHPLAPETFRLKLPAGGEFHDLIQGKVFTVDANGQVNGAGRDLPIPPPPAGASSGRETSSEPVSWTAWLLPISVVVLLLAGCMWLAGRYRRRSGSV
jgi:hypothetical protein